MRAIFETAEGAIFLRDIPEAPPTYRIPIFLSFDKRAYIERSDVGIREKRYTLYDRCARIALYREVVE